LVFVKAYTTLNNKEPYYRYLNCIAFYQGLAEANSNKRAPGLRGPAVQKRKNRGDKQME